MSTRLYKIMGLSLALLPIWTSSASAEESTVIQLLKPQTDIGRPLMQVLKDRKTTRIYRHDKPLPMQELSNVLWAAYGINRSESGKRTAPSSRNRREIEIYVATEDGLFLYEAGPHALKRVLTEDIRAKTGVQVYVEDAPLSFVYVADLSKMIKAEEEQQIITASLNTGFIGQNVYLYCASEGLVTGVRSYIDKPSLRETMKLRPDQRIILAQSVGYPTK